MSATLFGFIGYVIILPEKIGIAHASKYDLECFVHFWRVIGYALGIEDRFNICRGSFQETKAICEEMFQKALLPNVYKSTDQYLFMSNAMVRGINAFIPVFEPYVFRALLIELVATDNVNKLYEKLRMSQKILFNFVYFAIWSLRYKIPRIVINYFNLISLNICVKFSLLAYVKFGKNSQDILPKCLK